MYFLKHLRLNIEVVKIIYTIAYLLLYMHTVAKASIPV